MDISTYETKLPWNIIPLESGIMCIVANKLSKQTVWALLTCFANLMVKWLCYQDSLNKIQNIDKHSNWLLDVRDAQIGRTKTSYTKINTKNSSATYAFANSIHLVVKTLAMKRILINIFAKRFLGIKTAKW